MNRNDVIDVLSLIRAVDHRTVGEMDVNVWQAVIGDLGRDDALEAVRGHLREQPDVWLAPGHIAQRVLAMRRDRQLRESRAELEARQEALDERLVQELPQLIASTDIDPKFKRRSIAPELLVHCPWQSCRARPAQPCVNHDGKPLKNNAFHPSRTDVSRGVA